MQPPPIHDPPESYRQFSEPTAMEDRKIRFCVPLRGKNGVIRYNPYNLPAIPGPYTLCGNVPSFFPVVNKTILPSFENRKKEGETSFEQYIPYNRYKSHLRSDYFNPYGGYPPTIR